ncbi:hypothetical protein D1AOALGA4SA_4047 [Olavius algarvensis Delta 1 endosymbiont]|nr:hypothetical protein D1AOALGA4SA_4047 [Olavius algarvensis Delta 1 endosymbiont]
MQYQARILFAKISSDCTIQVLHSKTGGKEHPQQFKEKV